MPTLEKIDTEALKAKFDLRELAAKHVELHRHTKTELCGPCPKCGGENRFYVSRDLFGCRQCKAGGDVIAFVQWIESVSFVEAVHMLDANALPAPVAPVQPARKLPTPKPFDVAGATAHLARCQAALPDSPGADYLSTRCLLPATWAAYKLGYDATRNAIAIPWFRNGNVAAIKYRLLAPRPDGPKLISEPGSSYTNLLFGAQALETSWFALSPEHPDILPARSLVLVEGEINAMSIWQAAEAARVDVLSLGHEGAHIPETFLRTAARYRAVVVWMDKEARARAEAARLPNASAFWSESDGVKVDANDHLRGRALGDVIAMLMWRTTPEDKREALKWDLFDAGLLADAA